MAGCASRAGRFARHAGALFTAARRLLPAAGEGRAGRGAEVGPLTNQFIRQEETICLNM